MMMMMVMDGEEAVDGDRNGADDGDDDGSRVMSQRPRDRRPDDLHARR